MPFQSTLNINLGFGVVGELFDDSPVRSAPWNLVSADPTYNVVGRAFTAVTSNPADGSAAAVAAAGGTGVFAGLLANPKVYASQGGATGTLSATLALPNNTLAELISMGHVIVAVPGACAIGDQLTYNTTTGALGTVNPVGNVTYSQATTVVTVTAVATGMNLGVGSVFNTSAGPTTVISLGTGTGGNGTYNVDTSRTVSSETKTARSVAPAGFALIADSRIINYAATVAGVAVVELV